MDLTALRVYRYIKSVKKSKTAALGSRRLCHCTHLVIWVASELNQDSAEGREMFWKVAPFRLSPEMGMRLGFCFGQCEQVLMGC